MMDQWWSDAGGDDYVDDDLDDNDDEDEDDHCEFGFQILEQWLIYNHRVKRRLSK